jgi:Arc/MetJ-type ribon-helix-helix transcriptional regulator
MSKFNQIAFQITNDDLNRVDATVPEEFPSRAAALRAAVHDWLARRNRAAVDEALEKGYADVPEDTAMTSGLSTAAREALAEVDLEW